MFSFWSASKPTEAKAGDDGKAQGASAKDAADKVKPKTNGDAKTGDVNADKPAASEVKPADAAPSTATEPASIPLPASPIVESPTLNGSAQPKAPRYRPFSLLPSPKPKPSASPPKHTPHAAKHPSSPPDQRLQSETRRAKRALRLLPARQTPADSARVVRALIAGPPGPAVSRAQVKKAKAQLMQDGSAAEVIRMLKALPADEEDVGERKGKKEKKGKGTDEGTGAKDAPAPAVQRKRLPAGHTPIHAVCFERTDEDMHTLHFATLDLSALAPSFLPAPALDLTPVTDMLASLHLTSLVTAPDLGLGARGDADGVLAGALPTPEDVLKGVEAVTPSLMALAYATGQAIVPDHTGVYPPTDRMSCLTYWWGLEVTLPPPTLVYLSHAPSISSAVINFLSALALVAGGVREVLPFVRYIGQFVDVEWKAIHAMDRGRGVVCAATWVMPAAMVPRPWDFSEKPKDEEKKDEEAGNGDAADGNGKEPAAPAPVTPADPTPAPAPAEPAPPKHEHAPNPYTPDEKTPVLPPISPLPIG